MKRILYAITICLLFVSCDLATFDQPQPVDSKSLSSFPDRIQGKYLSEDGVSMLVVSSGLMVRLYDFDYKMHKDSLFKESYKLTGDTLIDMTRSTKEKVTTEGDSVILHVNAADTLFNISADNVLKKWKGYYFLNTRILEKSWAVRKVYLKDGKLIIGSIGNKEDIQHLQELTESTADTASTHFTLTKKQFKNFVKQKGFRNEETFTRIIKPNK